MRWPLIVGVLAIVVVVGLFLLVDTSDQEVTAPIEGGGNEVITPGLPQATEVVVPTPFPTVFPAPPDVPASPRP
jgi:hypothetical protein